MRIWKIKGSIKFMKQRGFLTYANDSKGNLVYVDDVAKGFSCGCVCPSCGEKLIAKNGGSKRIHHFAHASGNDCETAYETMLHQLAKIKVQEAFLNKDIFNLSFEFRSYCPHAKNCAYIRYDNCYLSNIKVFNLKEYYDSCEQERKYNSINRRSDLKIFSSKNSNLPPIYIEFFVTHKSDEFKLHNGGRIIEIKLESEKDIDTVVEDGFIESIKNDSQELEDLQMIKLWGFKTEDFNAKELSQEIEFSRYILYKSGKSQCYRDISSCRKLSKARKHSLLEICFHTLTAFGIYEMAKYQGFQRYNIKNCLYCKNYVEAYNGIGLLCRLYKHLGINRYDNHDTTKAKECNYFKLNIEEMSKELKKFESLSPNEYTEL